MIREESVDWWEEIEERIARWEEIDERGERGARRLMREESEVRGE